MRGASVRPTRKQPHSSLGRKVIGAGRARGSRSPGTARSVLELRALQHFRLIIGSARRFDADVRRTAGISGSLLWALSEIAQCAGMSVNALSERMAIHQTTASNIVNSLVERKLVRRRRDEADQRVVHLDPSSEGIRLLGRIPGPHAGLLVDALRRLESSQIERLTRCLATLIADMRSAPRSAAGETLLGE